MAFSIPTYDVHVRPKYYAVNDGAASGYRAVWVKHTSPATGETQNGGRLIQTPQGTESGPKSWEWWSAWRCWIDPAWDPALQGSWGRMHNWHNESQDTPSSPCGSIGWTTTNWSGTSGSSSLAQDYNHADFYQAVLWGSLPNGGEMTMIDQAPKGVWHSFLTRTILGRTDGTIPSAGHPNGGKGRVWVWVNGSDTPLDSGDQNTLARGRCNLNGVFYNQTMFAFWDGFYTKNCTQDCHFRMVAARFGRTLSECLADVPVFNSQWVSNTLDPNGIGPNLGPSSYTAITSQLDTDFPVPPSLGGGDPEPPPETLPHTGRWTAPIQWNASSSVPEDPPPTTTGSAHSGRWTDAVEWNADILGTPMGPKTRRSLTLTPV